MNYKLTIAYDGTNYSGWQVQSNATSIQTLVQNALSTALRSPTQAVGSGRTDAGVHALGQTAHFTHEKPIDPRKLQLSLNALLPPAIRILAIEEVPLSFHARFSAIRKIYHYHLHLDPVMDPFKLPFSTHVLHPVDLSLLMQSAALFVGTHDFSAFANAAHTGSAAHNAVRTLYRLDLCEEKGGVRLEFEGNGFLYKMVRNIVGTLLDITKGKLRKEEIPHILAAKDRRLAGRTAPPQGLFLVDVKYKLVGNLRE
jgi:tRNA pseudouridine38-40 synthase